MSAEVYDECWSGSVGCRLGRGGRFVGCIARGLEEDWRRAIAEGGLD